MNIQSPRKEQTAEQRETLYPSTQDNRWGRDRAARAAVLSRGSVLPLGVQIQLNRNPLTAQAGTDLVLLPSVCITNGTNLAVTRALPRGRQAGRQAVRPSVSGRLRIHVTGRERLRQ